MKTHIDFFETFKGEFLAGQRFKNRLIRWWGTETLDGVEVLKEKFYIYPNTNSNPTIRKLTSMLGMWSDIKDEKWQGVASYWLYFNPAKADGGDFTFLTNNLIAEKIDSLIDRYESDGTTPKWYYGNINFTDKDSRTKDMSDAQVIEYVQNNYFDILSSAESAVNSESLLDDDDIVGELVFYSKDQEFEIEFLNVTRTSVAITRYISTWGEYPTASTYYVPGVSISYRFKRIVNDIAEDGPIVSAVNLLVNRLKPKALKDYTNSDYETSNWISLLKPEVTNEIFYRNRLRVEVLKGSGLKASKAATIVLGCLDTGYTKKKTKWWKNILGFVIILIAIFLAVPSGGTSLTAAQAALVLLKISLYVGIATLINVGLQAYFAKQGDLAAADYMGRWVQMGSIISLVTGIAGAIQGMASRAAAQKIIEQGLIQNGTANATLTVSTTGVSTVGTNSTLMSAINTGFQTTAVGAGTTAANMASNMVAQMSVLEVMFVNTFGVSGATLSATEMLSAIGNYLKNNIISVSKRVLEMAVKIRQDDMESQLQAKQAQAQQAQDEYESMMDKGSHLALEDIKWYTDQLATIRSRYDYDALYERDPTTMHIGNIQRSSSWPSSGKNLIAEELMYT